MPPIVSRRHTSTSHRPEHPPPTTSFLQCLGCASSLRKFVASRTSTQARARPAVALAAVPCRSIAWSVPHAIMAFQRKPVRFGHSVRTVTHLGVDRAVFCMHLPSACIGTHGIAAMFRGMTLRLVWSRRRSTLVFQGGKRAMGCPSAACFGENSLVTARVGQERLLLERGLDVMESEAPLGAVARPDRPITPWGSSPSSN